MTTNARYVCEWSLCYPDAHISRLCEWNEEERMKNVHRSNTRMPPTYKAGVYVFSQCTHACIRSRCVPCGARAYVCTAHYAERNNNICYYYLLFLSLSVRLSVCPSHHDSQLRSLYFTTVERREMKRSTNAKKGAGDADCMCVWVSGVWIGARGRQSNNNGWYWHICVYEKSICWWLVGW